MTREEALYHFCLRMGDSYLILGHRLSELCGHGPILEQDIALTNIALDELGQARFYLEYAAKLEGKGRTEDDIAYFRDVQDFKNMLLTEQPNGHFGNTIARQFLFDAFNYVLVSELRNSTDEQLAAIAEKAIKEITYHLRFSSDWIIRLGDGTEESNEKIREAFDELWMFTDDLFATTPSDELLVNEKIIPDFRQLKPRWEEAVKSVLEEATLSLPESPYMMKGSREGVHTENLGYILAELQFMQRAYPGCTW